MVKIHKEGRAILLVFFIALLIINLIVARTSTNDWFVVWLGLGSAVLFLAVTSFFRNPGRNWVEDGTTLIAPADGKVVVIEEVDEPEYFKEKRLQVSIFMSVSDVHINRWPANGTVKYYRHHSGRFYAAFLPKASTENERSSVVLECDNGVQVLIRQIAGAMARRIVTYASEGQKVNQNTDMGFIKFGSRVDLFLPRETNLLVKVGDKVKGGVTQLASI